MRENVLLIGMLNSLHFANWLERIQSIDRVIYLYPSRQYRNLHPKIAEIVECNKSVRVVTLVSNAKLSVYLEFLLDTKWLNWLQYLSRKNRLSRLLRKEQFGKIHAIEIQHAGYLLREALPHELELNNIIVTNWGSDIYFYRHFPEHAAKIREVLAMADFYSAECIRDYELAREFGFAGTSLPLVPNSTTFSEEHFRLTMSSPKERHQIIMKCYGATFGYGNILLQIAHSILLAHEDLNIYAYSVTDELIQQAEKIRIVFGNRFKYTTLRAPVTHEKILDEFSRSRIYIGASKSDGISTSFLEALATGAFPIQTSTSCAGEWVNSGALAGIVQPSKLAIEEKLEECIKNYDLLEKAQAINFKLAEERLSYSRIAMITQNFYA